MPEPAPPYPGPFHTELEAIDAARITISTAPGTGAWAEGNLAMLLSAIRAARVTLGAYDRRVVNWLTGLEPQMVAVIAGLITRATPSGDPGRCAVCRVPAGDTELHFCPSHKRWECRDVSACVARIRQSEAGKENPDGH